MLQSTHRKYLGGVLLSPLLFTAAPVFAASPPDGGPGAAPPPASSPEWCQAQLQRSSEAVSQGKLDAAFALADAGRATCGNGYGFFAQLGRITLLKGKTEEAASFFAGEFTSPQPAGDAFNALLALYPRLRPEHQAELAAMGNSLKHPLQVPHMGYANEWITQAVCQGKGLNGLRRRRVRNQGITVYDFECPSGTHRQIAFRFMAAKSKETPVTGQPEPLSVEEVLPQLEDRYGIASVEALRAAVEDPAPSNHATGWLLSFLMDAPTQATVYTELLRKDPNDLVTIVSLVSTQTLLGDYEGALKTLDAASLETATLTEVRSTVTNKSALLSNRCSVLMRQQKLDEAMVACKQAIALGSKENGPYLLGKLLFLQGEDAQALASVRVSLANAQKKSDARFLEGLILTFLGQPEQAREAWRQVPWFGPAATADLQHPRSRAEWIRVLDAYQREDSAARLARCGHYYLDLRLPGRADACFSHSKAVNPIHAVAERIDHEAESDPERALKRAKAELRKGRHPSLLRAIAMAHLRAGRPQESLRWVDEAMRVDPGQLGLKKVLDQVCASLEDPTCLEHYRERTGRRAPRP